VIAPRCFVHSAFTARRTAGKRSSSNARTFCAAAAASRRERSRSSGPSGSETRYSTRRPCTTPSASHVPGHQLTPGHALAGGDRRQVVSERRRQPGKSVRRSSCFQVCTLPPRAPSPSASLQVFQIHRGSLRDDRLFEDPDSVGVESWRRFLAPPTPAAALAAMRSHDRKGLTP